MQDVLDDAQGRDYYHGEQELAAARRLGLIKTPQSTENSVLDQLNNMLGEMRKLLTQTRGMLLEIDRNVFGGTTSPANEFAEQLECEYPSPKLLMLTHQVRDALDDAQAIRDAVMALTKAL